MTVSVKWRHDMFWFYLKLNFNPQWAKIFNLLCKTFKSITKNGLLITFFSISFFFSFFFVFRSSHHHKPPLALAVGHRALIGRLVAQTEPGRGLFPAVLTPDLRHPATAPHHHRSEVSHSTTVPYYPLQGHCGNCRK